MVLRLCIIFALLLLGCSNPYERDNPTDPIFVYTVTFNASDATSGTPPAAVSGSWGDVVTLPDGGSFLRNGYVFKSWADPADSKNYPTGSSYTITGNAAMNVTWLPVYTVTFDGDGATSGTAPPAMTADSNSSIQIPSKGDLERTGYHFWGWYDGNKSISTGSSYTVTGNVTIRASWYKTFTITFDGNGATGGTVPKSIESSSAFTTLPSSGDLEKSGYIFVGWNTNSSGTGTRIEAGSSYQSPGGARDTTLYAEWLPCNNSETQFCDIRGGGQKYRITTIGEQVWFAENLNYNASGSECPFSVCANYGRWYDWATAKTACPAGWHLPNNAEWTALVDFAGGETAGKKLKATTGWKSNNGTDDYGFSALPGGCISISEDRYTVEVYRVNTNGYWWSSSASESSSTEAYQLLIDNDSSLSLNDKSYSNDKSYFCSVRCVKD